MQGDDLSSPHSVLACVKHFAGDGGTVLGRMVPEEGVRVCVTGE